MASDEGKKQPASHAAAAWRRSGFMKGPGIPAPSGPYEVGCVDVMLPCYCKPDEDAATTEAATSSSPTEPNTILMRLFYPAATTAGRSTEDYAKWFPHPKYVSAYADSQGWKISGLWSTMMKGFTTPRTPALLGVPLIGGPSEAVTESKKPEKSESDGDKDSETANKDNKPTVSGEESKETGGKETEQASLEPAEPGMEPASSVPGPFPIILFSHEARHMRTAYSGVCCDLASHGYVVASVEHGDGSACLSVRQVLAGMPQEGQQLCYREEWVNFQASKKATPEQLQLRVKELQKALDVLEMLNEGKEVTNLLRGHFDLTQFKNRLQLDAVAAVGHALGGAAVVQMLFNDQRIKCGIGLDSLLSQSIPDEVFLQGIQQPLLFVNSFRFLTVESIQLMKKLGRGPDEINKFSPCQILTIKGTVSQNLSDVFFALPDLFVSGSQPSVSAHTIHSLVTGLCHTFLNRFLLKDTARENVVPNLDGGEGASEHIIFGTNVQEPETVPATSSESGVPSPVEDGATMELGGASPSASDKKEGSEEDAQQQQQEGAKDSEMEKVEQHSVDEAQEGSGEGSDEKGSHSESLHKEQPKEAQLTDQSTDAQGTKPTEPEVLNACDEPPLLEDQPQPEENQPSLDKDQPKLDHPQREDEDCPRPDDDKDKEEKPSTEDSSDQPHGGEVESQQSSQQPKESPVEDHQDKDEGSSKTEDQQQEEEEKSEA